MRAQTLQDRYGRGRVAVSPNGRVHPLVLGTLIGLVMSVMSPIRPRDLGAQQPSSLLADSARLATITTDTGAFAPGHRDFSRYDTPGLCRAAARVTRASFQLSLEAQTIGDTLSEDTIGVGGTAPIARACGAHFTLAGATARELGDLFDLALHEQNDPLAQAVLTKLVAQDVTPSARDDTYVFGLRSYLLFGRLAAAEALLAQLHAPGAVAPATLSQLHFLMGGYFDRAGDTVRFRRELERELTVEQHNGHQGYGNAQTAYEALMRLAAIGHPDSMLAVAQQAQRMLSTYTAKDQGTTNYFNWGRLPLDSVIDRLAPVWYTYRRHGDGAVAPRLQADYWFSAPGHPSSDTVRPARGKVNLICVGGYPTDSWAVVFNGAQMYSGYQQAMHIRHWLMEYGAAGLEVTVVRPAPGYAVFDIHNVSEWQLFPTPAEEARLWRWYAQEYEQLPVAVAVQVKHTTEWLPAPDGRRLSQSKPQINEYFAGQVQAYGPDIGEKPGVCTIIGRNGVILYSSPGEHFGGFAGDVEVMLKWLFQGPGASVAASPGAPTSSVPDASPAASSNSSLHPSQGNSQ